VLRKGPGEFVITAEVGPGAKIVITVLLIVQHTVNGRYGRNGDGTRWQAFEPVCVVGGIDVPVLMQDPLPGEIPQGKLQRRISRFM
jgi:hypothetical protein